MTTAGSGNFTVAMTTCHYTFLTWTLFQRFGDKEKITTGNKILQLL